MALPFHEVNATFLASELSLLGGIPFDKRLVTIIVDTNRGRNTLNARSIYTPDLCRQVRHVALGEGALSQDEDVLREKFELEDVSNTESDLVVKLKVDEGDTYLRCL